MTTKEKKGGVELAKTKEANLVSIEQMEMLRRKYLSEFHKRTIVS
jgi:hypothetical protein